MLKLKTTIMQFKHLLLSLLMLLCLQNLIAQKSYLTTGGDIIFSFSNASRTTGAGSNSINSDPRFTLWFHFSSYYHIDFTKNIGIYTGIHVRNLGLTTNEPSSVDSTINVKWKRRSYALGVPLAIKIGALDKDLYFFFGGEYDYNFHYKEKEFLSNGKRKFSEWNSNRVTKFIPSVFGGVSFPGGFTLQLVWQLENFINPDYTYYTNNGSIMPNANLTSRIFYISLGQQMRYKSLEKAVKTPNRVAVL